MSIERIGNRNILYFGNGDISVDIGSIIDDENQLEFDAVGFRNIIPVQIGTKGTVESMNVCEYDVIMVFGKIESIDVVIRGLEQIKLNMISKIESEV